MFAPRTVITGNSEASSNAGLSMLCRVPSLASAGISPGKSGPSWRRNSPSSTKKPAAGISMENEDSVAVPPKSIRPVSIRLAMTWLCPNLAMAPARYTSTRSSDWSGSMRYTVVPASGAGGGALGALGAGGTCGATGFGRGAPQETSNRARAAMPKFLNTSGAPRLARLRGSSVHPENLDANSTPHALHRARAGVSLDHRRTHRHPIHACLDGRGFAARRAQARAAGPAQKRRDDRVDAGRAAAAVAAQESGAAAARGHVVSRNAAGPDDPRRLLRAAVCDAAYRVDDVLGQELLGQLVRLVHLAESHRQERSRLQLSALDA